MSTKININKITSNFRDKKNNRFSHQMDKKNWVKEEKGNTQFNKLQKNLTIYPNFIGLLRKSEFKNYLGVKLKLRNTKFEKIRRVLSITVLLKKGKIMKTKICSTLENERIELAVMTNSKTKMQLVIN